MTMLNERTDVLEITDRLQLKKNSYIRTVDSSGNEVDISGNELSKINNLESELAALDGLTASAAEINGLADVSERFETLTANRTLTAVDSNKVFFLNAVAGFDVTLPAPVVGMTFHFIVQTAPTSNGYDIATNGGDDIMKGIVTEADSATGAVDQNADNLNLAANVAVAGDWVDMVSDGTSWFVRGQVAANGGAVFSTA